MQQIEPNLDFSTPRYDRFSKTAQSLLREKFSAAFPLIFPNFQPFSRLHSHHKTASNQAYTYQANNSLNQAYT